MVQKIIILFKQEKPAIPNFCGRSWHNEAGRRETIEHNVLNTIPPDNWDENLEM